MRNISLLERITPRESESVKKFFNEMRRYPLLTVEEEEELAFLAKGGDARALERLILCNLRFVVTISNNFVGLGVPQADLISAGNIGLIHAAKNFDPERGFRFTTYAAWRIQVAIMEELIERGKTVRIPENRYRKMMRVLRYMSMFEMEHERQPSNEEAAEALGLSIEEVTVSLALVETKTVSFDSPVREGDSFTIGETLSSPTRATDSAMDDESRVTAISIAMDSVLTDRERRVIEQYYGLKGNPASTYAEIGKRMGLSIEGVRKVKERAKTKLKNHKNEELRYYLCS